MLNKDNYCLETIIEAIDRINEYRNRSLTESNLGHDCKNTRRASLITASVDFDGSVSQSGNRSAQKRLLLPGR